jgi:transforming growth factor-beta-induced protein
MASISARLLSTFFVLSLASALPACSESEEDTGSLSNNPNNTVQETPSNTQNSAKNILDVAGEAGQFNILLAAIKGAGLEETLKGPGPFTVFAPTDAAFRLMPQGVFNTLDRDTLASILKYHVHAGSAPAATVVGSNALASVQGENIAVKVDRNTVYLNGFASVVQTDITASNGVIHIIDAVLLPPSVAFPGTLVDALKASPSFSTLVSAVVKADLAGVLSSNNGNGFTVFAPTNKAFEALGIDLNTLSAEQLANVLTYHVVSGQVPASQVAGLNSATTVQGSPVAIQIKEGKVFLNEKVQVIQTDLRTNNGIIHVVDAVLLPSP